MDGWKHWFVLLLPLCVHGYSKETVVKKIGREPDIIPVCMSEKLGLIVLVSCQISTERHQRDVCRLLFLRDKQVDHECDSRFSLINKNQSVSIHLTSLTPADSGNYTCECSYERGTHVTHLNMTVEDEEDSAISATKFISVVVITLGVATTFVVGLSCGCILRRNHQREHTRSGAIELTRSETPWFLKDQDDHYTGLQRPASDIYQAVISSCRHCDAEADSSHVYEMIHQETDGKEKDLHSVYTTYETI